MLMTNFARRNPPVVFFGAYLCMCVIIFFDEVQCFSVTLCVSLFTKKLRKCPPPKKRCNKGEPIMCACNGAKKIVPISKNVLCVSKDSKMMKNVDNDSGCISLSLLWSAAFFPKNSFATILWFILNK